MDESTDLRTVPELIEPLLSPERPETVYREIMLATRRCILYGTGGFAVLCIVVGAVEALFGR